MKSGDLVALATSRPGGCRRFPTCRRSPIKVFLVEASLNIWMALPSSAKAPRDVIERLSQALEDTMKDLAVVAAVDKAGMVVDYRNPAATAKLLETEHDAVKKVVTRLWIGQK